MTRSEAGKLGATKSKITQQKQKEQRIIEYNKNPRLCKQCLNIISYKDRNLKKVFCSGSCAAIFNNTKRKKEFICLNCNKNFFRKKSTNYKFCSVECNTEYKRKQKDLITEKSSTNTRQCLRKYLIRKYGNKCMSPNCGWDYTKGNVILDLHHKDGNSLNNSIENCILLCPNCHSLTDTYKSKNVGKGRYSRRIRYKENKSY